MSVPVRNEARGGARVNSGRPAAVRLSPEQWATIEQMTEAGASANDTALAAGCSSRTVVRYRATIKKGGR